MLSVTTFCCIENHVCCMEPCAVLKTCINSNTFKMISPTEKCLLKVSYKYASARLKKVALVFYYILNLKYYLFKILNSKYFREQLVALLQENLYNPHDLYHQKILAFVCIPAVRKECGIFVENWNSH